MLGPKCTQNKEKPPCPGLTYVIIGSVSIKLRQLDFARSSQTITDLNLSLTTERKRDARVTEREKQAL